MALWITGLKIRVTILHHAEMGRGSGANLYWYIRDVVHGLAAGTKPSQPINDIRPGYRKAPAGSHVLFFKVEDTGTINIIRILHSRMDTERHL